MKKYIEINNHDELVLVDNNENKCKYSIKYSNGNVEINKINDQYNNFTSIKEIDINTLACISSLDNFMFNSENQNIPKDMISNLNNLHDYMYNKINDKNKINSENLICTKYYKVSCYSK